MNKLFRPLFPFLIRMTFYVLSVLVITIVIAECYWRSVTIKDQVKDFIHYWKLVGEYRG